MPRQSRLHGTAVASAKHVCLLLLSSRCSVVICQLLYMGQKFSVESYNEAVLVKLSLDHVHANV